LGEINDPRVVDPLIEALGSSEYGVYQEAFHALGEIKDPVRLSL
jgi:HEAT repeat protein